MGPSSARRPRWWRWPCANGLRAMRALVHAALIDTPSVSHPIPSSSPNSLLSSAHRLVSIIAPTSLIYTTMSPWEKVMLFSSTCHTIYSSPCSVYVCIGFSPGNSLIFQSENRLDFVELILHANWSLWWIFSECRMAKTSPLRRSFISLLHFKISQNINVFRKVKGRNWMATWGAFQFELESINRKSPLKVEIPKKD